MSNSSRSFSRMLIGLDNAATMMCWPAVAAHHMIRIEHITKVNEHLQKLRDDIAFLSSAAQSSDMLN